MVPVISPYAVSRAAARRLLAPDFYEVHACADIATLEDHDTKGLYARARNGEIANLIGISPDAPYEALEAPGLVIDSHRETVEQSGAQLQAFALACIGAHRTADRGTARRADRCW